MKIAFGELVWQIIIISRVSCSFTGCDGKQEIYIQWHPPISGWYSKNLSNKNQYTRNSPGKDDPAVDIEFYEFALEREGWILSQWTKEYYKRVVKSFKNEDAINSHLPKAVNVERLPVQLRRKRSGRRQGLIFDPNKKNEKHGNKETSTKTEKPFVMPSVRQDRYLDKELLDARRNENFPTFNVYCPGRCRCLKAIARPYGTELFRFDFASRETLKSCLEKVGNITDLPEEITAIINRNIKEDVWENNMTESKDTDDDRAFPESFNHKEGRSWEPEFYVSKDCSVLYFNKFYDAWIFDRHWDAQDCITFRNSRAALEYYISNGSSPCLEYLPWGKLQQWSNPQPYLQDEGHVTIDDIIQHCGMNFTVKPNDYFNVVCLELAV